MLLLTTTRAALLAPLQSVAGIVENMNEQEQIYESLIRN